VTKTNNESIKEVLTSASEVLVLLPSKPTIDMMAAGLALFDALKTGGKNPMIACPSNVQEIGQGLVDLEEVSDKIGNRNLVISLKVASRESIDKVSYNLDEGTNVFNLVIQPKKGQPPLKSNDIEYSYMGVQADVVFLVGVNRLEDLGVFYQEEAKLFTEATTISLNRFQGSKVGAYNFGDNTYGSLSEVVVAFFKEMSMKASVNAATNLLTGIEQASNHLQGPSVGPETFEVVAQLMRWGGKRQPATPTNGANGMNNQEQVALPNNGWNMGRS
jgi:nanoRNase/pAp phosphatase (c-di-AMP/oligoRNAs hydrolase)